ncbi:Type I inositol 1,4,5-trisphosphate 5-phosphatase 1 [Platanthera guangdongensis]|uniref:Type I inositol 1,4,5-trisphosphate 5-phosphatase 1 n=1 Tax=Platanthera guangdongensis TaxID=2320717 RepID=A0ABR2M6H6_9ASPA
MGGLNEYLDSLEGILQVTNEVTGGRKDYWQGSRVLGKGQVISELDGDSGSISLQEIVQLNGSNIFGAKDNRHVPRWECLIRSALNKIQPAKLKYKSYSNPSSSSRYQPSDDTPCFEDALLQGSDSETDEEVQQTAVFAAVRNRKIIVSQEVNLSWPAKSRVFLAAGHCWHFQNLFNPRVASIGAPHAIPDQGSPFSAGFQSSSTQNLTTSRI